MLRTLKSDELSEYDRIIAFVRKAVESSKNTPGFEGDENLALSILERRNKDAMVEALSE
jgi:hypothetical protein